MARGPARKEKTRNVLMAISIRRWLAEHTIKQWVANGMPLEEAKALWHEIDSMKIIERKDLPPYAKSS